MTTLITYSCKGLNSTVESSALLTNVATRQYRKSMTGMPCHENV
jgi:hypothetical protein